ncbi:MAG TPA: lytic transglycosylase domain-containing protein [Alphaproteobacteria bacterium]|nr:lytic transglycosylase domain-containing protein [Alphaproteobacteria bacterium]
MKNAVPLPPASKPQVQPDRGQIVRVVHQASQRTGADFGFMLANASLESSMAPGAKNRTSSATGLFQFTESTWLAMVKDHGARHGLGQYAKAIQAKPGGGVTVADPALRREILELRKDPQLSALMAGEYARQNERYLEKRLGRQVGTAEIYAAHFFGPNGAAKLLQAVDRTPGAAAADVLPSAAKANRSLFYAKDGTPRSAGDLMALLARKIDRNDDARPPVQVADVPIPKLKPGSGTALAESTICPLPPHANALLLAQMYDGFESPLPEGEEMAAIELPVDADDDVT